MRIQIFIFSLVSFLMIACNPARSIEKAVQQKNNHVRLQYPNSNIPTPAGINMVYDFEQLYTPEQQRKLDTLVRTFEKSNLIAIKVITVNSDTVTVDNFDAVAEKQLQDWDRMHGKTGKSMVVLISKSLKKVAEKNGEFVDKFLSEQEKDHIFENIFVPHMPNGEYYTATDKTLRALMDTIRKNIAL